MNAGGYAFKKADEGVVCDGPSIMGALHQCNNPAILAYRQSPYPQFRAACLLHFRMNVLTGVNSTDHDILTALLVDKLNAE